MTLSRPEPPVSRGPSGRERFLGMDGGGSKTAFVVVDATGTVLARARTRGCYALDDDGALLTRVVTDGLREIRRTSGITAEDITFAAFGIPGFGERSSDVLALEAVPGRVLGHDRFVCVNDVVGGWSGALGGRDGIDVVAGTGSIAYGEADGRSARAGGWSELFGDEGSGYWIAIRALGHFGRTADGRLPPSLLADRMRAVLGVRNDLDVIGLVVGEWAGARDRIAALAPVVLGAAAEADPVAQGIVDDAHEELAALVLAVRTGIGWPSGSPVPVSWSGGLFDDEHFRAGFLEVLGRQSVPLAPVRPLHGADVGTALYAQRRFEATAGPSHRVSA
jgi:N-acetylglucosamine kinase-like BadF-type ATPase